MTKRSAFFDNPLATQQSVIDFERYSSPPTKRQRQWNRPLGGEDCCADRVTDEAVPCCGNELATAECAMEMCAINDDSNSTVGHFSPHSPQLSTKHESGPATIGRILHEPDLAKMLTAHQKKEFLQLISQGVPVTYSFIVNHFAERKVPLSQAVRTKLLTVIYGWKCEWVR